MDMKGSNQHIDYALWNTAAANSMRIGLNINQRINPNANLIPNTDRPRRSKHKFQDLWLI